MTVLIILFPIYNQKNRLITLYLSLLAVLSMLEKHFIYFSVNGNTRRIITRNLTGCFNSTHFLLSNFF